MSQLDQKRQSIVTVYKIRELYWVSATIHVTGLDTAVFQSDHEITVFMFVVMYTLFLHESNSHQWKASPLTIRCRN